MEKREKSANIWELEGEQEISRDDKGCNWIQKRNERRIEFIYGRRHQQQVANYKWLACIFPMRPVIKHMTTILAYSAIYLTLIINGRFF